MVADLEELAKGACEAKLPPKNHNLDAVIVLLLRDSAASIDAVNCIAKLTIAFELRLLASIRHDNHD